MRCNNCGWDNTPGTVNCIKCGHSLQMAENNLGNIQYASSDMHRYGGEQSPRPTVIGNVGQQEVAPRPTRIMNPSVRAGNLNVQQVSQSCPTCGYPVAGDYTSCPNCGTRMSQFPGTMQAPRQPEAQAGSMSDKEQASVSRPVDFEIDEHVKCQRCGADVSIDYTFCPKCGERIHLPTVRAIRRKPNIPEVPKHKCFLELILEDGEITAARKNEYEGDSVILNRENTEPDNRTITSREQAELMYEDGKWYLVNKSELCSTFIEAGRKIEILAGDVVVMGDRRFRFATE